MDLVKYRKKEGNKLVKEIKLYIKNIQKTTKQLRLLEKARHKEKKKKILQKLTSIQGGVNYDPARLEQEMIYYFEKYDITEERVRLDGHCQFFLKFLKDEYSGRKLKLF